MPTKARSQNGRSSELTATIAAKVFGWKNVHTHKGELIGKKLDKAGKWRKAKVPDYANDPRQGYVIDERMKQLGHTARYLKELSLITKSSKLPAQWATPQQRGKAAIKALRK